MTSAHAAVAVHNLHVAFEKHGKITRVLEDVSFELAPGECLAIVGESGSGKSVLGRTILGIDDPTSIVHRHGDVEVHARANGPVAMIYQDPMTSLNPTVRIWRQLVESRRGIGRRAGRALAVELLRAVGVPDPERRIDAYPHEFSGGMMQRVGIAAALAGNPAVLIADEPTTALDVTMQRKVLDLLDEIRATSEMSMILITHDVGLLTGRADRTMVLYAGRVLEVGPTLQITTAPSHPYTQRLLSAIPRVRGELRRTLPAVDGGLPPMNAPRQGCPFAARCQIATDRCHSERPPAIEIAPGHVAHCWDLVTEEEK